MYEDIFAQIRNEAEKRNLKETINAYCKSVGYFLRIVNKDVSALTTDDVDAFLTEKAQWTGTRLITIIMLRSVSSINES